MNCKKLFHLPRVLLKTKCVICTIWLFIVTKWVRIWNKKVRWSLLKQFTKHCAFSKFIWYSNTFVETLRSHNEANHKTLERWGWTPTIVTKVALKATCRSWKSWRGRCSSLGACWAPPRPSGWGCTSCSTTTRTSCQKDSGEPESNNSGLWQ